MTHLISLPAVGLAGEIAVPGDKSISHRALIFGALAVGITTVDGLLEGDDCLATLDILRAMGVQIEGPVDGRVVIHGVGREGLQKPTGVLQCGNSGTSMRLLAGVLAAQSFDSALTGDTSLCARPMARIVRPLSQMGAHITTEASYAPISLRASSGLRGIEYVLPEASAQVKSCVLLAGMYARGQTTVIEKQPTRDHTERMLKTFSYPVACSAGVVSLVGGGTCLATSLIVPGDLSSAAFFMVAATLIPGASLLLRDVGVNPTRTGVIQLLRQMGASIMEERARFFGGELVADLYVQYAPLKGIDIPEDMVSLSIDELPILLIAAASACGQTVLRGAAELKFKESDRLNAMMTGLRALGIEVQAMPDGLMLQGGKFSSGEVDSLGDHRIAMAFAIAGLVATGPVTILNTSQITTSFPTFVSLAHQLQLPIREYDAA